MPVAGVTSIQLHTDAVATGDGVVLDMAGVEGVAVQIVGITSATITFEATVDGATWVGVALANLNSATRARALTATADGLFLFESAPGVKQFRARISAWVSGTINVYASPR